MTKIILATLVAVGLNAFANEHEHGAAKDATMPAAGAEATTPAPEAGAMPADTGKKAMKPMAGKKHAGKKEKKGADAQ